MTPTQDVPPPIRRPATRDTGCGAFGFLGMIAYSLSVGERMFDRDWSSNYIYGGTSMSENFVRGSLLYAAALWILAAGLLGAAWITWAVVGGWQPASLLAISASVVACGAVVAHMRCYALHIGHLIRVHSVAGVDRSELRTVR